MSYILYIDESGDEGIENLKSAVNTHGSHPLFFFGAYLANKSDVPLIKGEIDSIESKIGTIHFSHRNHEQKIFCCQKIAGLPIKCFGLVSDKHQLSSYRSEATKKGRYYNKNVHYLLENVGMFCNSQNYKVDEIIFEKKEIMITDS